MSKIEAYDIVEVTRDNGKTWEQYATIKPGDESTAIGLVEKGKHRISVMGDLGSFRIVDSRRNIKLA
jgi:hypothetical protein